MRPLVACVALALSALASPAGAADRYWGFATGCASHDFSSTSCWRLGPSGQPGGGTVALPPGPNDIAHVVQGGATTFAVSYANSATAAMPRLGSVAIRGTGTAPAALSVARNRLEAENLVIGRTGLGRLDQTGGNVAVTRVQLGSDEHSAVGTYLMTGGSLVANEVVVGFLGSGLMEVSGPATATIQRLLIASNVSAQYRQSGGTTTARSVELGVSGTLRLSGGVLNAQSVAAYLAYGGSGTRGSFELSGGTLNLTQGADLASFTMSGGTLNFSGSLFNAESLVVTGALTPTVLTFGQGQTITATDLKSGLIGPASLNLHDGAKATSTTATLGERVSFAGVGDGSVVVSGAGTHWGNSGSFSIAGTASVAGGRGALTVTDSGTLEIGGGLTLWADSQVDLTSAGLLTAARLISKAGSVVNVNGGSLKLTAADALDSFAGTLNWTAGEIELNGRQQLSATGAFRENLTLTAGQHLVLAGGGSLAGGANSSVTLRGGKLEAGGDVAVGSIFVAAVGDQRFVHEGVGTVRASLIVVGFGQSGAGAMTVRAGAQVRSESAGIGLFAGGDGQVVLEGSGVVWQNSGHTVIGGNTAGTLSLVGGGRMETATVTLGGPAVTSGLFQGPAGQGTLYVDGAGSAFVVTGDVSVSGDATAAGGPSTLAVVSGGRVDVGGLLRVWGQGTVRVGDGGTLTAGSLDNAGTFAGVGTVQADIRNSGRLAPGLSPGALNITGNLEQTSEGLLDIELTNLLSFDQLTVTGGVMLGGTLALSCHGACTFAVGDSLQLLSATGGVSGSFSNITWGSFAPDTFDVIYGANEVRLLALANVGPLPVPEPGTYGLLLAGLAVVSAATRRRRVHSPSGSLSPS